MNKGQQTVLVAAAVLVLLMFIVVPWELNRPANLRSDGGYHLSWEPPDTFATVDSERLYAQLGGIAVMATALVLAFRTQP